MLGLGKRNFLQHICKTFAQFLKFFGAENGLPLEHLMSPI
jgi:hypothetical protein